MIGIHTIGIHTIGTKNNSDTKEFLSLDAQELPKTGTNSVLRSSVRSHAKHAIGELKNMEIL